MRPIGDIFRQTNLATSCDQTILFKHRIANRLWTHMGYNERAG
jgi:hypothetical protein